MNFLSFSFSFSKTEKAITGGGAWEHKAGNLPMAHQNLHAPRLRHLPVAHQNCDAPRLCWVKIWLRAIILVAHWNNVRHGYTLTRGAQVLGAPRLRRVPLRRPSVHLAVAHCYFRAPRVMAYAWRICVCCATARHSWRTEMVVRHG